jgi:hypothetical protein
MLFHEGQEVEVTNPKRIIWRKGIVVRRELNGYVVRLTSGYTTYFPEDQIRPVSV